MTFIDPEANVAFIHVPKTGGRAIQEHWFRGDRRIFRCSAHDSAVFLAEQYPELWNPCRKFAVVRNPWDWWVSAFHYYNFITRYTSFRDFILRHGEWLGISKGFPLTGQWKFLYNEATETKLVDEVFRLTELQAGYSRMRECAGLPPEKLGRVGVTRHCHYSDYYDDETREIVATISADDIRLFGFAFDDVPRQRPIKGNAPVAVVNPKTHMVT